MDILYGMVSMVKDIKESDREFRNINFQIKYTIQKGLLLLKKISDGNPNISFMIENLNRRISEGQAISKKLDQLLNAESIAIQDRIRLSLPFNQTKNEAIKMIQSLEKAIADLKEEIPEQEKADPIRNEGGVKRKVPVSIGLQQHNSGERENEQIDQHIEEIYEMGPTINDDELHFSQSKTNKCTVEFTVEVKGLDSITKILQDQFPDILMTKKQFSAHSAEEISEMVLYTVARLNFQKCYNKIKGITKDIDRISTKSHFHFVLQKKNIRKQSAENGRNQNGNLQATEGRHIDTSGDRHLDVSGGRTQPKTNSSKKKNKQFLEVNNSKEEEQIFFSFPQDQKIQPFQNLSVLMRKEDDKKVVYRFQMGEWMKIEEQQIEIGNGEKLAAFINPQTKQPTIYFQLTYGIVIG